MHRVRMDHALLWNPDAAAFEQVPFPERFPRWRFEPAFVDAGWLRPEALSALAQLTRIDPDVPVYVGPRLLAWDIEHQDWGTDRRTTLGICQTADGSESPSSHGFRMPIAIAVSLQATNPVQILAHEMMHIVLRTLPAEETDGIGFWGDFIRFLDQEGFKFHIGKHYDFLQHGEEAEAEAFGLWAGYREHPYNISDEGVRRDIERCLRIDLSWVPSYLSHLESFYEAILQGDYSARRQILKPMTTVNAQKLWVHLKDRVCRMVPAKVNRGAPRELDVSPWGRRGRLVLIDDKSRSAREGDAVVHVAHAKADTHVR